MDRLPDAPDMNHDQARILHNLVTGDRTYAKAYQFGQVIYAPFTAGSWSYAHVYEASALGLLGSWTHEPMNGRMSLIKQCARELSRLTDWPEVIRVADKLPHEVLHDLVARANASIRAAQGRSWLNCRSCAAQILERFSTGAHSI
jgi:hypothetical protein